MFGIKPRFGKRILVYVSENCINEVRRSNVDNDMGWSCGIISQGVKFNVNFVYLKKKCCLHVPQCSSNSILSSNFEGDYLNIINLHKPTPLSQGFT